ncbi:hypothetical protein [Crossiella sp. CA198]|uniref:hypothetical protein n=1 Tax=Crossiella sp. CA198 TaxID=3455607 RepID=UPI003F8D09B9
MSKWIIHTEKTRNFWNGSSTTMCGLTITKVEVSDHGLGLGPRLTCPACKAIKKAEKAEKRAARKARGNGGWW